MAAIALKFSGTFNNSDYLKEFSCVGCQQYISDNDIAKNNYNLWVSDYANDLDKDEFFSDQLGRRLTAYNLTFWLKAVEHLDCPEEGED